MIKSIKNNLLTTTLILISSLSLCGAIVYRVYALNNIGIIISVVLGIILFSNLIPKLNDNEKGKKEYKFKKYDLILYTIYCLFFVLSFLFLFKGQTDKSIISPWEVVSKKFFIAYLLSTLSLVAIIYKKLKYSLLFISLHYFLSFSVVWIVYKIGYGYDPFIHKATLDLIKEKGLVDPKPFYYLGQYSLVLIANKLIFIPISVLNKLLVPFLASIFIPMSLYNFLSNRLKSNKISLFTILFLLVIPFTLFTSTVPQNLSYLFLLILVLFNLNIKDKKELYISYTIAFTTLLIHPLAGIPAVLLTICSHIYLLDLKKLKNLFYVVLSTSSIIALPLSFYLFNSSTKTNGEKIDTPSILSTLFKLRFPNTENFILNFIYFFKLNFNFILLTLVISSFIYFFKNKDKYKDLLPSILISSSLFMSYLITSQMNFSFLISYERSDYANRILTLAFIVFLPIFLLLYKKFIQSILRQNKFIKWSFLLFLSLLITYSLYTSYPRLDNYHNSHGYSVSSNDLEAVNWIEEDADGEDYIVLANQQVSVGALSQFGFKKYYKGDIYFYPIPTGGQMYKYYLDMVYKEANKETMVKAMNLAGVDTGYFILNKYWWAFPKILEEAKINSDLFHDIKDGEVYVFKYTIK